MKRMKKIVSVLLAVVMVLGMSMTVFAGSGSPVTTGTITLTSSTDGTVVVAGKSFVAYQILTAEIAAGANLTNSNTGIVYRVPDGMKDFYKSYFSTLSNTPDNQLDSAVSTEIGKLTNDSKELEAFTKAALAYARSSVSVTEKNDSKKEITVNNPKVTYQSVTAGDQDTSVVFENLPLGYYLIEDVSSTSMVDEEGNAIPLSALVLNTTKPDVTVNIKATKPTIGKEVNRTPADSTEADEWDETNNAAIGDVVEYRLTDLKVPDMRGYVKYQYMITDTLSKGLTFVDDDKYRGFDIKIGSGERLTAGVFAEEADAEKGIKVGDVVNGDYAVEITYNYLHTDHTDACRDGEGNLICAKTTTVKVVFADFIKYREQAGAVISVNYSAILNDDAVIGTAGNENSVKLTYSNDPVHSDDGLPDNPDNNPDDKNPVGETVESDVYTYVTGIQITKIMYDGDRVRHTLEGAQFQISGIALNKILITGEEFVAVENPTDAQKPTADNEYYWGLNDNSYTKDDPNTTGMNTEKYVKNDAGEYVIYEKKPFTTASSETTEGEETRISATAEVNSDGVLVFKGLMEGEYKITELVAPNGYNLLKEPIEVSITWNEPEESSTACSWTAKSSIAKTTENPEGNIDLDEALGIFKFDVENTSGALLPSTGGIGTTIFYVVGSILVLAAVVLLVAKKRMSAEK